jgi:hypothetical protein
MRVQNKEVFLFLKKTINKKSLWFPLWHNTLFLPGKGFSLIKRCNFNFVEFSDFPKGISVESDLVAYFFFATHIVMPSVKSTKTQNHH